MSFNRLPCPALPVNPPADQPGGELESSVTQTLTALIGCEPVGLEVAGIDTRAILLGLLGPSPTLFPGLMPADPAFVFPDAAKRKLDDDDADADDDETEDEDDTPVDDDEEEDADEEEDDLDEDEEDDEDDEDEDEEDDEFDDPDDDDDFDDDDDDEDDFDDE